MSILDVVLLVWVGGFVVHLVYKTSGGGNGL